MKRALITLLIVTVVFALACNTQPATNDNNRAGSTANTNASPRFTTHPVSITVDYKPSVGMNPQEVLIEIKPDIIVIAPGDKIAWNVLFLTHYEKTLLADLTLHQFKDLATNTETDVFGGGSSYTFSNLPHNGPITTGNETGPANASHDGKTFKYRITALVQGKVKVVVDPRVIISTSLEKKST